MGLGAEISQILSQLLPGPTCTAEIRLALEVWDFSKDCQNGPGTLPDVFSRDAKLRLSGYPCFPWIGAHSCASAPHQCWAGILGPSSQDLGWRILVLCLLSLWSIGSLPELPPPQQGKAGGTGELEMALERGRTDGFGLGCFFPSSQRSCMQIPWLSAVIPKAGSCWMIQGSASLWVLPGELPGGIPVAVSRELDTPCPADPSGSRIPAAPGGARV